MAKDADVDAHGLPVTVKHFCPPGMRHAVWQCVHALEKPIVRGPKTFTHVCLLCVRAKDGKWEDALCRISNTSNAMKHMKSRHKDWEATAGAVAAPTQAAGSVEDDADATASEGETEPAPSSSSSSSRKQAPAKAESKSASDASGSGGAAGGSKRKADGGSDDAAKEAKKPATKTSPAASAALSSGGSLLEGKVVVITGASGGIGAAIAKKLAVSGAKVALGARRLPALEQIRDAIAEATGTTDNVLVRVTDVTKREDLHSLVKAATDAFGDVDILVNNAGVMPFELLRNVNQDSWDRIIDINCKGVLNGIAAVLPRMLERKSGHIVNISSDAGRKTFPGLGVYSASKMFVEGVSQALRLENVGSGLRVTSIQPGNVATDLVQHGHSMSGVDEEAMKLYGAPSGYEVLKPEDIANAVHYAVTQPLFVAVNEILVEPRDEPI